MGLCLRYTSCVKTFFKQILVVILMQNKYAHTLDQQGCSMKIKNKLGRGEQTSTSHLSLRDRDVKMATKTRLDKDKVKRELILVYL